MKQVLFSVFVDPLMRIYEAMYSFLPPTIGEGGSIVFFSLLLNLLLMPVYAQMERKSRAGRELRARVATEVARMKRHFRGRELYYYIRAVHRQYGYRPISHLLGSSDLLVQVLVFATVYHFLSGLETLQGARFGPLSDLSRPDGLMFGFNLMPFIMTAINAAAVFAYVDDKSRRLQALALAMLFLVLLYASPAGLVLYWTMNNLFSLIRARLQRRMPATPPLWNTQLARLQQQR